MGFLVGKGDGLRDCSGYGDGRSAKRLSGHQRGCGSGLRYGDGCGSGGVESNDGRGDCVPYEGLGNFGSGGGTATGGGFFGYCGEG